MTQLSTPIKNALQSAAPFDAIRVQGWIRTRRDSKDFSFIELNDGSSLRNLQIIAKKDALPNYADIQRLNTGASLVVEGALGLRVERPPWARGRVQSVSQSEAQPLDSRPGDHRAVIGAKLLRRGDHRQAYFAAQALERVPKRRIRGDAARGHHSPWRHSEALAEEFEPHAHAILDHVNDRGLKRGAEVVDVAGTQRGHRLGGLTDRSLQAGQ